jgi:hypothetical protein
MPLPHYLIYGMRNKQDRTDYKKLWIALLRSSQLLAMTDNRLTLRPLPTHGYPSLRGTKQSRKFNCYTLLIFLP